jgi:hypothetical protein
VLKTGGEQTAKQSATGATGAPGVTDADAGTEVLSRFVVTLDEVKLQWRANKNVVPIPPMLKRWGVGTQARQGEHEHTQAAFRDLKNELSRSGMKVKFDTWTRVKNGRSR